MYEISYNDNSIYIGHSKNLKQRVKNHYDANNDSDNDDGIFGSYVTVYETSSKTQAQDMERRQISDKCPLLNKNKPDHCKDRPQKFSMLDYQIARLEYQIALLMSRIDRLRRS